LFSVFVNAWKVKDIRKKMLYVLMIVLIYRIGANIPLPGMHLTAWQFMRTNGTNQTLFATIAGGGFGTIFAMGIGPYITSSIIMQLLSVAVPKLEQLKKEGEEGRKKINQYTRVIALVLAILQSIGIVFSLSMNQLFIYDNFLTYLTASTALVTGTVFVMWLSELLTEKGIGNGASFIIFSNVLASFPAGIMNLYYTALMGGTFAAISMVLLVILFVLLVTFAILIQGGERRIPVQYSKKMAGRQMQGGQASYIPLKVNIAGVMSIIFAISLLQFPATMAALWSPPWLMNMVHHLQITMPIGAVLYMILIVAFTFFYTSFAVNPIEMAENMKKGGGFIPGIRPGKPTSEYIQKTVHRLSWIGACFYVILAMVPVLFQWIFDINVGFGGTTLLIVTGVALEIVKQLQSQLLMRDYKGFLS